MLTPAITPMFVRLSAARSSRLRRHALSLAAASLLGLGAVPHAQAASCTWNATSGNWNALGNWINCITGNGNPTGVPGAADTATIGAAGVVAVTNAQAINALINAGTINIASGGSLLLNAGGGGTSHSGTVNVASGGVLSFDGRSFAHAIGGGGSFVLAGGTLRMEGANTTTLAAGTAIRGAGNVGSPVLVAGAMSFVNNGTVSADANAATLTLNAPAGSGSYTNNSLFEARNGGTLSLNASLTQGAGGQLRAESGSAVRLNGITVDGGTVGTAGTGVIQASNDSRNLLSNVTLAGVVDLASATSQLRVGNGLAFGSGGAINVGNSTLYIDNRTNVGLAATQDLGGSGSITLAGGNIRFETANPAQTTIGSNVTISGHGNIGQAGILSGTHTLINNGLISANSNGNTLVLQPISNGAQAVQNNGVLEATGGGTLRLDTSVANSSGSQLRAGAGSAIVMNGVTVSGAVNTTGSGTVTASNNSANLLSNVTLNGVFDMTAGASQVRVGNGLSMEAGSSIRVGASTLYIDNRSNAGLAATQALGGSGSITLAGGNIRFETNTPAQTTLGSGVTISGHGNIGLAGIQAGQHTLVNNGLISANSNGNTLVLQPISNSSQPVQNNGVLEATGGGTLRLDADVVGGAGSQLRANAGSAILMNGVTVSGAVNTAGGGTVTASNNNFNLLRNVTLDGVIDLSPAAAQLRVGDSLVLSNGASIKVGASTLYLDNRDNAGLSTTQSLTGSGSIRLAAGNIRFEANNPGGLTLGAGVTVAGYGNFGQAGIQSGNLSFVNQSSITADVSGQTLQVLRPANGGSFSNEALLEARNGGTLLVSTDISQTVSGSLQAQDGSTVRISGSTVSGGALGSAGTGAIRATNTSANLLSNVTLAGVVDLASAASQLRIGDGLVFSGGTVNVGSSTLYLDNRSNQGLASNQTLSGNGSITLAGGAIRMEAATPAQTTLGSGVTISGHGAVGAAVLQSGTYALVNNGTIAASTAGQTLTLQPFANGSGALSGTGRLQVAGGTLAMTLGQASTQGALDIGASGTLAMNAQNLVLNTDYISAQWGSGNSFNRRAGVTGAGQILAGGDAVMAFTGTGISGGNSGNATLTIGNVRVGASTFNYQLANAGSSGPTLRGAIQTSVNGGNLTDGRLSGAGVAASNFNAGAPGSNSGDLGVIFTVFNDGPIAPLTGQVLNFRSNFDNLADQRLNIVVAPGAAAYNAAVGLAAPDPIQLPAQRVGGTALQALTISNLPSPGGQSAYSEDLNASFGTVTGAALASGSASGVLAGGSNGSAMSVGLNTATAGALSGSVVVQFETAGAVAGVSNGLGTAAVGSQTIAVSGNVYAPSVAQVDTPNVNFGIVRVGDMVPTQTVSVSNTGSGALTDTLRASLAGGAAPFTASGTASGIAAGGNSGSALSVGLNTAVAGIYSSSGTLSFSSQNPEMADLPLGSASVGFSAQVNNLAAGALSHSGAGSFSGGVLQYVLNFGTVIEGEAGGTASLSLANIALGPADALAGSFDLGSLQPGDPFTLAGFTSFSGLAAGDSLGGLVISFGGNVLGSFDRVITLNTLSTNGSGPDLALAAVELRLLGEVAPIPEPGTWAMWLAGLAAMGSLMRRRQRLQTQRM